MASKQAIGLSVEQCYQSFKRTGYVCGGCSRQGQCPMNSDSARYLDSFIQAIDPSRQAAIVKQAVCIRKESGVVKTCEQCNARQFCVRRD